MQANRRIRMLVTFSKTNYFLDKGRQMGITAEAGRAFEEFVNDQLKTRNLGVHIVFVPMRRDEILTALRDGRGDLAAANLTITDDRSKLVDFSRPVTSDVSEIVVTTRGTPAPASVDDLSGRDVYVRQTSSYYDSLRRLNAALTAKGKRPVNIIVADEQLEDEDILEMVNAGLVEATIIDSYAVKFWKEVFPNIQPQPSVALATNGQIAWAIRKNSPALKQRLDVFIEKNRGGTMTGNVILKRYLQNTRWARGATSKDDLRRFNELIGYFKKYATEYDFDWLMLAAQGYQESRLDQKTRSPVGAIGVMQVMPTTARDKNVGIKDIHLVEPNIHAGVKYLRFLVNEYFDEPGIDFANRHLFAFAAYNAGPNRIARLRKQTAAKGLDPDKWFNNVELLVAEDVGRETVQYVSNIYKYYIAYKLTLERARQREGAKSTPATATAT